MKPLVLVRSGGNIASGIIYRLHRAGFPVIVSEVPIPKMLRREASYGAAVHNGEVVLERLISRHVSISEVKATLKEGVIPVVTAPYKELLERFKPTVVVDSIHAGVNVGTSYVDAELVIAAGAGFVAGEDVDVVVEVTRGYTLGRCLYEGSAFSAEKARIMNETNPRERLTYAPKAGLFTARRHIGEMVAKGEVIGHVDDVPVHAHIQGCLRGILMTGLMVDMGDKVADVDANVNEANCFSISDRALAIGGGVVEAVLAWMEQGRI